MPFRLTWRSYLVTMNSRTRLLWLIFALALLLPLAGWVERGLGVASLREAPASVRFSLPSGRYARSARVTLRPSQARGQIVFTTDGTRPTATLGTRYGQPLRLDAESPGVTVLRAVEVIGDIVGPVETAVYALGLESQLPILSLAVEPADLWDAQRGLFTNPAWRGADWERPVTVSYLPPNNEDDFTMAGGLRVHGDVPLAAPKQSLRLYFRSEYGPARLTYPLWPGHPAQPERDQTYKRLLLQAGDNAPRWSLLRDQLVTDVAVELGLPTAQGQFVWLFINGDSWGLYRLTERVERFFLAGNYGLEQADVVQEGNAREGADVAWEALVDWAAGHALADPVHYATLQSQVDLVSFIDFAVLKQFFDFPAESLLAVQPEGGRWFWVYQGGGQYTAPGQTSDWDMLWAALFANADFRARFQARLADMLNVTLSTEALLPRVERLDATLAAAFAYEQARWPGVAPWADEVAAWRAYVSAQPVQLLTQFAPEGTAVLHFSVEPPGAGRIYVNGQLLPAAEWEGHYSVGTEVEAIALPAPGYAFAGAELAGERVTTTARVGVLEHAAYSARFAPATTATVGPRPDAVLINEWWINDNGTRYASLDQRPLFGDWVELLVTCAGPVDVRGWRLTDNDTKTATDEGSISLPDLPVLAAVRPGTIILIVATETPTNTRAFPVDDLDARDGRLLFYVGNGALDVTTDPGFGTGTGNDNLALLAPGPTAAFDDDVGVDFVAEGRSVTPYTFGILADGVTWDTPFRYLGRDDGVIFAGGARNDDIALWHVDPAACASGDAVCLDRVNQLTPGALNPGQWGYRWGCVFGE